MTAAETLEIVPSQKARLKDRIANRGAAGPVPEQAARIRNREAALERLDAMVPTGSERTLLDAPRKPG